MKNKKILYHNADRDGCSRSILSGCFKFGSATLLRKKGSTMTSIIEIYDDKRKDTIVCDERKKQREME